MRDLTILMDLVVGRPAQMLAGAAAEHITISAGCLFPRLGRRVAHVAVDPTDVATVTAIVERYGGIVADDRECLVIPADFPGGLVAASTKLAEAGIMVNVSYFGARGQIVMATTDVEGTRAALGL